MSICQNFVKKYGTSSSVFKKRKKSWIQQKKGANLKIFLGSKKRISFVLFLRKHFILLLLIKDEAQINKDKNEKFYIKLLH